MLTFRGLSGDLASIHTYKTNVKVKKLMVKHQNTLTGRLSEELILSKECDPNADAKALPGGFVPAHGS